MEELLKHGFRFYSKWFDGLVEVLEVRENDLEVKITRPTGHSWHEEWNLLHTVFGFQNGEYSTKKFHA
jgi:hypothetical protein